MGFFSPAFPDPTGAKVFVGWLEDWRRKNPFDPTSLEQENIAKAIGEFMQPILGVDCDSTAARASRYAAFFSLSSFAAAICLEFSVSSSLRPAVRTGARSPLLMADARSIM